MHFQLLKWDISIQRRRPTTEELAAIYNKLAEEWPQKLARLGMDQAYVGLMATLHARGELAHLDGSSRVLDAGIGTGALTDALHQVHPAGWQVTGVDLSPAMLAEAAQRLGEWGIHTRLHLWDLRDMPLPPGGFDLVMSAHTLEHLPDPEAGIRSLARLLRPGAPLVVVITRRDRLGTLVDAKWDLRSPGPAELVEWLTEAGLVRPRLVPLGGPPWCRLMSLAAVARRPAGVASASS